MLEPLGVAPAPHAAPCEVLPLTVRADTVLVAVVEPVDFTHAPAPATDAERFVFGTLYQTLVRVDCQGRVMPALANGWTREDSLRWRITLRDDARFWDGTPVTAGAVTAAWAGRGDVPADSVAALDARTLLLVRAQPDTALPRWLADPRLAVALPAASGAPPLGTGRYAVTAWSPSGFDARPTSGSGSVVRFRLAPGADPRDLLDQGGDLLVTDDPEALRYAGSREGFDVAPLPWTWTYVLAGGSPPAAADAADPWALRDAVRADVRGAEPPFWWMGAPPCHDVASTAPEPAAGRTPDIAYANTDPLARDLAERLAAVWGDPPHRAVGLSPLGLGDALRAGRGGALVVSLPRRSYAACLDLPAGPLTPLVDTRSSVVVRRGRVGVEVDWDGAPRLLLP